MQQLRIQTAVWNAAREAVDKERAKLNKKVAAAKLAGYSYAEIREETGFGIATIQSILMKLGVL